MNDKRWPYWVKGGIISVLISSLITISLLPFGEPRNCYMLCFPAWSIPMFIGAGILSFPIKLATGFDILNDGKVFTIVGAILFYFLIGSIIGFFYDKIKNKSSPPSSTL